MNIFVVFRVTNPDAIRAALATNFPDDHKVVTDDQFLVSASMTAQELSDRLGVTDTNASGPAIIFKMDSYYGRAPNDIWDWVKTKAEAAS